MRESVADKHFVTANGVNTPEAFLVKSVAF